MMDAETRLFQETPEEKEERLLEVEKTAAEMAELESEKRRLFEELSGVGEKQKALARAVYAVEKRQREHLKGIDEYLVPGDRPLTHEDVERWADSVYWSFARTTPANPHKYAARKRCNSEMYERVVAFALEHGYRQHYGGDAYTVYDITVHGEPHFCWPMTDKPKESEVLNAKPASMRPQ
jgi:hypothetical protein